MKRKKWRKEKQCAEYIIKECILMGKLAKSVWEQNKKFPLPRTIISINWNDYLSVPWRECFAILDSRYCHVRHTWHLFTLISVLNSIEFSLFIIPVMLYNVLNTYEISVLLRRFSKDINIINLSSIVFSFILKQFNKLKKSKLLFNIIFYQ